MYFWYNLYYLPMRTLLITAFLLLCIHICAQSNPSGTLPHLLQHLMHYKGEIPVISTKKLKGLIPPALLPELYRREVNYLVKTKNSLYVGVDGTGMLFEVKDSAGILGFRRIDKTRLTGNSHGALHFTINDTIYSLGGYGFWRVNGQLRYYNYRKGEWSVIGLNKEIPILGGASWLDYKNRQLYVYGSSSFNQAIKTSQRNNNYEKVKELYRLDLRSGNWTQIGSLIRKFEKSIDSVILNYELEISEHNSFSFGHYNRLEIDNVYYDDFVQNRRWKASSLFYKEFGGHIEKTYNINYCIDSTIYMGDIDKNEFDSISLSKNHFYPTNEKVFTPVKNSIIKEKKGGGGWTPTSWLLSGALAGFLMFAGFSKLWRYYQNSKNNPSNPAYTDSENNQPYHVALFDEIETELINFILSKCKRHDTASVVEVNKILGLSGKNEAVQKKNRSEKINRINEKWRRATGTETTIIQRRRAELDKRVFEYYIIPELFSQIEDRL